MRLFGRRQGSQPSSARGPAGRPGRHNGRRARPEAEALDARILMAADTPAPADLAERVDQLVQPYLAEGRVPGVSVAVVADGQVALAQGYGTADEATGAPAGADTRFDIGSVTKTFTAMAVLMIAQESQGTSHPLDLDAPIGDYLHNTPSFKLPRAWSQITTRELLDMTSGIRNVETSQPWQDELRSVAKDRLVFTPGTESAYSNSNYYLLGDLIEQWTGERYGTFIQDQILEPLGMSQTEVLGASATAPDQAVGYGAPRHGRWPKAAMRAGTAMFASAGIVSTAQDMGTYMEDLLAGRLLDPATYQMMWTATPTPAFGAKTPTDDVRGLGWDTVVDGSKGPIRVEKSGSIPGFTTELILYPSRGIGVYVGLNTYHRGHDPSGSIALGLAEAIHHVVRTGS